MAKLAVIASSYKANNLCPGVKRKHGLFALQPLSPFFPPLQGYRVPCTAWSSRFSSVWLRWPCSPPMSSFCCLCSSVSWVCVPRVMCPGDEVSKDLWQATTGRAHGSGTREESSGPLSLWPPSPRKGLVAILTPMKRPSVWHYVTVTHRNYTPVFPEWSQVSLCHRSGE